MADDYNIEIKPPYPNKEAVNNWWASASEGQKNAMGQTVKALREWQQNPASGWFGESINPDVIIGHVRELGQQYGLDPEFLKYATYPAMKRIDRQDG